MSASSSSPSSRFFADQFTFAYPLPQSGYYFFPASTGHLQVIPPAVTAFNSRSAVVIPESGPVIGKAVNMNLVRSLVSSKRGSQGNSARDLQISHPQSISQQLSVDTSRPTLQGANRGSLIQQQSPGIQGFHDFSRQAQRQSQSYFPPQGQQFYPTPQPNGFAFPGSVGSPTGGPTSPAFMAGSPGFGQFPVSPVDYPTPGATPLSTPRYVLPSVVASQMEMEYAPFVRQQQQQQPPPPPPPPAGPPPSQPDFSLSDREWQEALQAQREYEQRMEQQQREQQIREQQMREQHMLEQQRMHQGTHRNSFSDADDFDERSFYDVSSTRRNTQASVFSNNTVLLPTKSFGESLLQKQQEARKLSMPVPPKKLSPEEEFYSSVNSNRSTTKLGVAQFTPDSDTPLSPESKMQEPPKPRSFSVDALSTNSYPVPTPISESRKPKDPTPFSMITGRFPNWFIDGTPLPANEEDDSSHGPLAKRRRTLSEAERESEQFWGIFYNGSGQWSRMWYRFLDGIYDYYLRTKCPGKGGLDPQTLGQMWEEMGYNVEENLYESQIQLAQSLFHPDPEDFISSLLTNYFSLLDLPHLLEQPPIQPPPSFLPKCVNPTPPVPIPLLTREGFHRYFIHQTLLDPTIMFERFNKLLKDRPTGIVDPETSLLFVRRETGGPIIPRKSFPHAEDGTIEEVEEKVRGWMRSWVKNEVEGWVGGNDAPPPPPQQMQPHDMF
ncbi:hypothetical protein TWF788_000228 [Orbilia oligospora]|uniref:DUF7514 domain-containing protein n=1 Tax=Orbilia oligospora TaxID=2813651 RepID=A0A7C8U4Y6_ORBOL|nr:hypothetical protein TWF788_000228 [Orbilia oligospora]